MYRSKLTQERITSAVSRLELRKDSLMCDLQPGRFEYVKAEGGGNQGIWKDRANNGSTKVKLIFRLQRDIVRCGDLCVIDGYDMEPIIRAARWRFHVIFGATGVYSQDVKEKLELQAVNLRKIQLEHIAKIGEPSPFRIYNFVQEVAESPSLYCGVVKSPLAFLKVNNLRLPLQTLADWYDQHGHLDSVGREVLRSFVVNRNIKAYDALGQLVDPIDYRKVFRGGTWIEADVMLKYSASTQLMEGPIANRTFGLYELELDTLKVLDSLPTTMRHIQPFDARRGSVTTVRSPRRRRYLE